MRRSKALPSKTVRSYRKVSQRRMTKNNNGADDDNDDDSAEMERLKQVLAQTQAALSSSPEEEQEYEQKPKDDEEETTRSKTHGKDKDNTKNPYLSILSDDLVKSDYGGAISAEDLVIVSKKKKKKSEMAAVQVVQLTAEERKEAKLVQKNTTRKLKQLQDRKIQKEKRTLLYQKLQQSAVSKQTLALLQPSATVGQTGSKKQQLRLLLQKERAGLTLTTTERELLYSDHTILQQQEQQQQQPTTNNDNKDVHRSNNDPTTTTAEVKTSLFLETPPSSSTKDRKRKVDDDDEEGQPRKTPNPPSSSEQSKKKNKSQHSVDEDDDDDDDDDPDRENEIKQVKSPPYSRYDDDVKETTSSIKTAQSPPGSNVGMKDTKVGKSDDDDGDRETKEVVKPLSFAAQMMASVSALKSTSVVQAAQVSEEKEKEQQKQQEKDEAAQESAFAHLKRYIPSDEPVPLLTAAAMGLKPTMATDPNDDQKNHRRVLSVPNRPAEIQVARYDLPVAAMEFEVMDTIRNNDVTIICGETGSGKSTQVPQFLYEAGLTLSSSATTTTTSSSSKMNVSEENDDDDEPHYMIGITQPRRVAAVSTAKRVCYELGHGDGQSIRNNNNNNNKRKNGNLVAYQTRYETAGLGTSTHIKFMTDGILLQEIQSDLLLRKYSVILIDEAHERNLNSDALVGLLSAALPLRKQAAEESNGTLVPLKVVIMSATLRVTDFTDNKRLFAASPPQPPAVLKIPGRTFSVTVHHSKTTEIEHYEEEAYRKICKIHRKLPAGGILVFLTGKQEIVRLIRRLRKSLGSSSSSSSTTTTRSGDLGMADVRSEDSRGGKDFLRDMDDDEVDGEFFVDDDEAAAEDDEDQDQQEKGEKGDTNTTTTTTDDTTSTTPTTNIPDKALILPLYSMLSAEEQARVFQAVPEGHRLIVVATNIAETSITIPGISYVVDTGRQKCRNFNAKTGVASYDIMWISKAAADQRAGRAGRTGPGHCYRLYSSSMYVRHMDDFALPEVLTRPLEDVVLAMKAMNITNVAEFPFPTPPGQEQLGAAVELLANIGCIDVSKVEENGGDGVVTRLGAAVAKLPLGVRYGKMLLVAAEAGVLDYAIVMVAVMSELSPFVVHGQHGGTGDESKGEGNGDDSENSSDDEEEAKEKQQKKKKKQNRWVHRGGDVLAGMLAVGAYTYAGRGAGGISEKVACRKFCEANNLHPVIMARIQKMRVHLARLAKTRLSTADGVAAKTGGILSSMKPPNKAQEQLLSQAIASGLLDNVAMLAPLGSIPGEQYSFSLRSAYLSCSSSLTEPLMMDRNSVVYSRDPRQLPKWICYDSVIRKTTKDGTPVAMLRGITPIDPSWLGSLAKGSRLLKLGEPLPAPAPCYDADQDAMLCSVRTKFGNHGWEISPVQVEMYDWLQSSEAKSSSHFLSDDSFRWFARYLLEGKVLKEFRDLSDMLNDSPALITRRTPSAKVALLVAGLAGAGVDSAAALRKHWAESNSKFLYSELAQKWIRPDSVEQFQSLWKETVNTEVRSWKKTRPC